LWPESILTCRWSSWRKTGKALEDRVGAGLWTVRYCSVVATIPLPGDAGRDELRQRLARLILASRIMAIGVGGRSETVTDTRASYREAASALQVGPRLGLGYHAVFDFQELAPLIALMSQPLQACRFAAGALAPLGELASRSWVLPTLEAYLARQGRLKEVAVVLGVHLNTVKYRLHELRPYIESSLTDGDRAATLLLALRVRHLLAAESDADPVSALAAGGPMPPAAPMHREGDSSADRRHSRPRTA
jgi:hypothetical protein